MQPREYATLQDSPGVSAYRTRGVEWADMGVEIHFGTGTCDVFRVIVGKKHPVFKNRAIFKNPELPMIIFRCTQQALDCLIAEGLGYLLFLFGKFLKKQFKPYGGADVVFVDSTFSKNVLCVDVFHIVQTVGKQINVLAGFLFGNISLINPVESLHLRFIGFIQGLQFQPKSTLIKPEKIPNVQDGFINLDVVYQIQFYNVENIWVAEMLYKNNHICPENAKKIAQLKNGTTSAKVIHSLAKSFQTALKLK